VPLDKRLSSWGSKEDRLIKEGSKSVVGPMYWLYRSSWSPRVLLSMVGPPTLAMSSSRDELAAVLERLESWCRRLYVALGELQRGTPIRISHGITQRGNVSFPLADSEACGTME
jgi:hypothetical protein